MKRIFKGLIVIGLFQSFLIACAWAQIDAWRVLALVAAFVLLAIKRGIL